MRKSITIAMLAMLAIGSLSFMPALARGDFISQSMWIRGRGLINQWGDKQVFGWIGFHARMVNINGTYYEGAAAHAVWSEQPRRLNCTEPPTENFTVVTYAARTINTTEVEMNYSGYDLFISGYWNVIKITTWIYVTETGELINITRTIEPLITEATGELHIFNNWRRFELGMSGIDMLSGPVTGTAIRYVEIKLGDLNDDGKVDLIEIVKIAKRFRTVPGLFICEQNMYFTDVDFNCNGEIDIGDLVTAAANIQA